MTPTTPDCSGWQRCFGASTGMFGAVWAQAEVRKVLWAIGARVVDGELPVARAHDAFDAEGRLADGDLHERLEALMAEPAEQVQMRAQMAA